MNPVESQLLDYAEKVPGLPFGKFLRSITGFPLCEAYELIAIGIDAPVQAVRTALRTDAPLITFGLAQLDARPNDLEDFVRLSDTGRMLLAEEFSTPEEMLRVILKPEQASGLTVGDYSHMEKEFSWLANYLKKAADTRVKGGNILFYGAPGTGKSEFARLLAQHAGLTAYAVRSADNSGEPESGQARLTNFALSQRFLSEQTQSMILKTAVELFGLYRLGLSGHGFATQAVFRMA